MKNRQSNKSGVKAQRITKSDRAGVVFSVGRIKRHLREGTVGRHRISTSAAVQLAAVLDYLVAEIFDVSLDALNRSKKVRFQPKHLHEGIAKDSELCQVVGNATFPESTFFSHSGLAQPDEHIVHHAKHKTKSRVMKNKSKSNQSHQSPRNSKHNSPRTPKTKKSSQQYEPPSAHLSSRMNTRLSSSRSQTPEMESPLVQQTGSIFDGH